MSNNKNQKTVDIKEYPLIEVNIDDLKEDPSNPNIMTMEQLNGLEKSITNYGRLKYVVVDQNLNILDGYHRIQVEKANGTTKLKVLQATVKNDTDRKIIRETLNQLHGEYDKQKQSSELLAIFQNQRLDELAELLGKPKEEFENLITRYNPEITFVREEDESKLPSLYDTETFVKTGEIWQLGRHRLMCGNCSDINNIRNLIQDPQLKADLLLLDPPYNTKVTDWDDVPEYFKTLQNWILTYQNLLDEKGSMYLFHDQMPTIARLMIWLEDNTNFIFHQFIVWNKKFENAHQEEYLQGYSEIENLRNYKKFAEYILFYTFQDETGLSKVMLDVNNFQSLRQYFKEFLDATQTTKTELMEMIGERADHCLRWNSTQWDLPTPETYRDLIPLIKDPNFNIKPYSELRQEYESLRQEYESQRYTFNNLKTHHSVWNYDIASQNIKEDHPTPKPTKLIETILRYSSNQNDIVLDPFLGSGSTLIAAEQTNRICYGMEIDEHYCSVIIKRWELYTGQKATKTDTNPSTQENRDLKSQTGA